MEIYSPGGMPDGSMIQDRDPLTVPSTRRNPILADVFNRLGYMERKGSGFFTRFIHFFFQQIYKRIEPMGAHNNLYQPFIKHIPLFVVDQLMHKDIRQLFIFQFTNR